MGRVLALVVVACMASCYQSPSLASCKYRCGGANNDSCPSGYSCNAGMCVAPGEGCTEDGGVIDAPPDDLDANDAPVVDMMIDAPPCAQPMMFTFMPTSILDTQNGLSQIVVLDANNDGKLDLAAMDSAETVGVYLGDGAGNFANTRISSPAGSSGTTARRILPGDWDHDGQRDDLLVLSSPQQLNVLVSDGDGSFTRTGFTTSDNAPIDIANLGDVNADTFDDIVIYYTTVSPRVEVMLQEAAVGTLGFETGIGTTTSGGGSAVIAGDVNSDGKTDAFVLMGAGGTQFMLHQGTGTTFSFGPQTAINVHSGPIDAVVGLVHASGHKAIVTASSVANDVSVRRSNGGPNFLDTANPAVGTKPVAVILSNIGGSSLPDIVTADNIGDTVSVLVNQDGANYDTAVPVIMCNAPVDVASDDFNGDTRRDLAVACQGSKIHVLLNKCPQ